MLLGILVISLSITGALVTEVTAANRDFDKAETIRIGSLGPVQLVPGIGIHNAAKMAVDEINEAGGIEGKKLELFIGDTEGKPEKGITAMKKLVLEDKVDVLVGCYSSGVALALQPFLPKYKIVYLASGTASIALTDNVKERLRQIQVFFPAYDQFGRAAAEVGHEVPHGVRQRTTRLQEVRNPCRKREMGS